MIMTDAAFSNRELTNKFDNLQDKLDDNKDVIMSELGEIKVQVLKTNGRVSSLEKWQSYVIGFCAAISLLLLPAFFIIMKTYIGG